MDGADRPSVDGDQYPGYLLVDATALPACWLYAQFTAAEDLLRYCGADPDALTRLPSWPELAGADAWGPAGGIGRLVAGAAGPAWVEVRAVHDAVGWSGWLIEAYERLASETADPTAADALRQHADALRAEHDALAALTG